MKRLKIDISVVRCLTHIRSSRALHGCFNLFFSTYTMAVSPANLSAHTPPVKKIAVSEIGDPLQPGGGTLERANIARLIHQKIAKLEKRLSENTPRAWSPQDRAILQAAAKETYELLQRVNPVTAVNKNGQTLPLDPWKMKADGIGGDLRKIQEHLGKPGVGVYYDSLLEKVVDSVRQLGAR